MQQSRDVGTSLEDDALTSNVGLASNEISENRTAEHSSPSKFPAPTTPAGRMRVLHLWKSDLVGGGGGAIAMNRLHSSLRNAGVDSRILCENKTTDSPYVEVIKPWHRLEHSLKKVTTRLGLNDIHRLSSFRLHRNESFSAADVIHLHGTHSGFINYLALPLLTRDKPVVFTLHDMWALTGHCAVNYDCERWRDGCGRCPHLEANPPVKRDATRIEWKLKNWVYKRSSLNIVTFSSWQSELVKSSILGRFPIHRIPNGVDTEVFRPLDPEKCRAQLEIPKDKVVLSFAAANLGMHWKGGDLLVKALQALPESMKARTILVLFGNGGEALSRSVPIQTLNLGYLDSDHLKSVCYSAADLFVHPSRAEMFPLVLLESMACGTPIVSFDVGGVPDLVRPGMTGYLAKPEDSDAFRDGIVQLLEDEPGREYMGRRCREIAVEEYSLELETQRFLELYDQLVKSPTA